MEGRILRADLQSIVGSPREIPHRVEFRRFRDDASKRENDDPKLRSLTFCGL